MSFDNITPFSANPYASTNITLLGSGNGRLVIAAFIQDRSPANLDTSPAFIDGTFEGNLAGTIPVNSSFSAAIWYWLDADLPTDAGTYAVTGASLQTAFGGVHCTNAPQAAPSATGSDNTNTVQDVEKAIDLSAAAPGALVFGAYIRNTTAGTDTLSNSPTAIIAPGAVQGETGAVFYEVGAAEVAFTQSGVTGQACAMVGVAFDPAASAPTGTIALTLPEVTTAISGDALTTLTGPIAVTLPEATTDIAGTVFTDVSGVIGATLPALEVAIAGDVIPPTVEFISPPTDVVALSGVDVSPDGVVLNIPDDATAVCLACSCESANPGATAAAELDDGTTQVAGTKYRPTSYVGQANDLFFIVWSKAQFDTLNTAAPTVNYSDSVTPGSFQYSVWYVRGTDPTTPVRNAVFTSYADGSSVQALTVNGSQNAQPNDRVLAMAFDASPNRTLQSVGGDLDSILFDVNPDANKGVFAATGLFTTAKAWQTILNQDLASTTDRVAGSIVFAALDAGAPPDVTGTVAVTLPEVTVQLFANVNDYEWFEVAGLPWGAGEKSIFENASPAVENGDWAQVETLSDQAAPITWFPDGTYIVGASSGQHRFDARWFKSSTGEMSPFVEFLSVVPKEGTIEITLPVATVAMAGEVFAEVTGTIAVNLPEATVAIDGTVFKEIAGTIALTLPEVTTALSGQVSTGVAGQISIALPVAVVDLAGIAYTEIDGAIDVQLPEVEVALAGTSLTGLVGTISVQLPAVTTALAGDALTTLIGTIAITLPGIEVAVAGQVRNQAVPRRTMARFRQERTHFRLRK